jgi:hypothetical protein
MKATVAVAVGMVEIVVEIEATTEPGVPPIPFAFARMFVIRKTRETPLVTGGIIGMPKNAT